MKKKLYFIVFTDQKGYHFGIVLARSAITARIKAIIRYKKLKFKMEVNTAQN